MSSVFVFAGQVTEDRISAALSGFPDSVSFGTLSWLAAQKACEVSVSGENVFSVFEKLRTALSSDGIDVFCVPSEGRRKKLLIADMDATIVTGETLDELAARAGLGEEISKVTAAAMRGEIDFEEALKLRVSKLKGLSEDFLSETFLSMQLSAGAETLVRAMRGAGAECVLVSGGFTFFTSRVANLCGFSTHHGNALDITDGVLTGRVVPPVLDKAAKLSFLESHAARCGARLSETAAVGDGANDLPMLLSAGLGVGYHPKPLVAEKVFNSIIHSDLTAILYMQGFTEDEIGAYSYSHLK